MSWIWIVIAVIVLLALLSGNGNNRQENSKKESAHWIYHPHVIEDDDYECSYCNARFSRENTACPKCGAKITGKTEKNEEEWLDEEEALDMLFDDE